MKTVTAGPKYASIALLVEAQILDGEWDGGRMPSVRGVAAQYKVSVVTASRALQVLRDKGLIQTVERSGCFRVPPADAERWALCLRLTPGPWRSLTETVVRGGFEALARRDPMHFDTDAFDLRPGLTQADAERAATEALERGTPGVLLLPNRVSEPETQVERTFLAGCRAAGLPVCLIERNLEGADGLPCDLVTMDDFGSGVAATRHLLALGRCRVGIVVANATSSHNSRLAGYLYALHGQMPAAANYVLRAQHSTDHKASYQAICDGVLRHKLDAVVCFSDYTAVGLIVELMHRGKSVPQDVAVVGFDDLPVGEFLPGGLTTFSYPGEAMAEQAVRLLRDRRVHPNRAAVQVVIPSELLVRGSTAGRS